MLSIVMNYTPREKNEFCLFFIGVLIATSKSFADSFLEMNTNKDNMLIVLKTFFDKKLS